MAANNDSEIILFLYHSIYLKGERKVKGKAIPITGCESPQG
jgi:hypothetical protein